MKPPAFEYYAPTTVDDTLKMLHKLVREQNRDVKLLLDASSFFLTYLTTNVEPDEVLTEVAIPIMPPRSGQATEEFSLRHGDFALVIATAQVTLTAHATLQTVRLGIGGVGPNPLDCSHALAQLAGRAPTPSSLREALRNIPDELNPPGDIHASTEYRKELAQTLAYRALDHAIQAALHP